MKPEAGFKEKNILFIVSRSPLTICPGDDGHGCDRFYQIAMHPYSIPNAGLLAVVPTFLRVGMKAGRQTTAVMMVATLPFGL